MAAGIVVLPTAWATPEALAAAIRSFTGGEPLREGKVQLDVATLVDNGNTVPVTVSVPGAPAAEVAALALFNERNPERDVARFALSERSGRAVVSTRIRLATSQQLVAIATMSDGSLWSGAIDVIVTLAACIEGEG
jgi:sulfur-oxidizing protein SoxY